MTTDNASNLRQFSDGLAAAVQRASASTVLIAARRHIPASGVVWSADGLIVTADHAIETEDDITVGLPDGRDVQTQLVGRDPGSDLALIRIEETDLPAAEVAPPGSVKVGNLVMAIGRPMKGAPQASLGVVSAISGPEAADGRTSISITIVLRALARMTYAESWCRYSASRGVTTLILRVAGAVNTGSVPPPVPAVSSLLAW